MSDDALLVRNWLEAFASDPQKYGRHLRNLLDREPALFESVAAALLLEAKDSPGIRYLLALLYARGMLTPLIRRMARTRPDAAAAVAQLAVRVDPSLHRTLVKSLLESNPLGVRHEAKEAAPLDVLEVPGGGMTLKPAIGRLKDSPDVRVRSKTALILGRADRAARWLGALLADPDPRVRANAVESRWSVPGPVTEAVFEKALTDTHHRVVANALVGQYLHGTPTCFDQLCRMLWHPDPRFRSAAIWAMGRTGDERFEVVLKEFRADAAVAHGHLRLILKALARIRQAVPVGT